MTMKLVSDESTILVLMSRTQGTVRNLYRPLEKAGFRVSFVSSTQEALLFLSKTTPRVFIQDWSSIELSQSIMFHQTILKTEDFGGICRIIVVKEITPQIAAIATDYFIRRVLTIASAQVNILEEVKIAMAGEATTTPLQKRVARMRHNPKEYDQLEIDKAVEEAYVNFSHDPSVKLEYGNLCTRRNEYSEAEQIATGLLKVDAANVRAMNLLSRCYMKIGDFAQGVKILESANILSPHNSDRLAGLGKAYLANGDRDSAKAVLVEALKIDPTNDEAAEGLGDVALEEGDAKQIVDMFENSLSEEELVGFFNNAAIAKVRKNNFDDAMSLYEMAMNATVTSQLKCLVQFNMGLALRKMNDDAAALRAFKRCVKLNPMYQKAVHYIKEVELEMVKKFDKKLGRRNIAR